MKKAFVTGAAGFIGYHLCSRLLDEEVDVVGIDMAASPDRIDYIARHAGFQYLPMDINEADLQPHTIGCDVIFHLACSVKPTAPWANIEDEVQRHVSVLKKWLHLRIVKQNLYTFPRMMYMAKDKAMFLKLPPKIQKPCLDLSN